MIIPMAIKKPMRCCSSERRYASIILFAIDGAEMDDSGSVSEAVKSSVRFGDRSKIEGETVGSERCAWSWIHVRAEERASTFEPIKH